MERTRRFWTRVGIAGYLALLGGIFGQPLLLLGASGMAAYLLAQLYTFSQVVTRINNDLNIHHALSRSTVQVGETVFVTLDVTLTIPSPVDLIVELSPPLTASPSSPVDLRLNLTAGQRSAKITAPIEWSVAGTFSFEQTRVTMVDPSGFFSEKFARDPSLSVTVDTRRPLFANIGQEGRRDDVDSSKPSLGRSHPGIEPVEVREYVLGDTLRRIDWNATARFNRPHVREYETESERSRLLVMDNRASLRSSNGDDYAFDYLRTVALGVVADLKARKEKLSLVIVGDDGATAIYPTRATKESYSSVRRQLLDLELPPKSGYKKQSHNHPRISREQRNRRAAILGSEDTPFVRTLKEFYRPEATFIDRRTDQPMYSTVRNALKRLQTPSRVMLFTSDINPTELQRTIDVIRKQGSEVSAFITPHVLFDPIGPGNINRNRERYLEFEALRKALDGRAGVEVHEIGPDNRLEMQKAD